MERRFTTQHAARIQIRADGDTKRFTGYAAVFYRESDPGTEFWLWEDYVERIMPGAFDRAIKERHDARGLFDHDSQNLLGRVSSGTLTLRVDDVGLYFEIPFDEKDPDHVRVARKIERGDLTGCSFAFNNVSASWEEKANDDRKIWVRNITDLDLWDVGPVTWPAYTSTDCGMRSLAVTNETDLVEARSALEAHRSALQQKLDADRLAVDFRWRQLQHSRSQ